MLKRISLVPLTAIVLLSLLIKLIFFFSISPWEKKVEKEKIVVSDSWGYEQMAENLLKYHSYAPPSDTFHIANYSDYLLSGYLSLHPDSYRMPLYSSFMAAIYFITGIKPYLVILVQILLSLLSVILVYRICIILFNGIEMAKMAALLFSIDIHSAFVANQLLTDTIFVLLFLASSYFFLKGLKNYKIAQIFLGGLFMGLAVLVRGVALFYPFIILLLIFVFSKQSLAWKFKAFLLYVFAVGCFTAIWVLRNDLNYGHKQLSTEEGSGILMYYVAYVDAANTHRNIDSVRVQYQKKADSLGFRNEKNLFNQANIYKKIASGYISKNKFIYIKAQLLGGINMYFSLGNVGMSEMLGWDNTKHEEVFAKISMNRVMENFKKNKKEALLGLIVLIILIIQYFGSLLGLFYLWKDKQYLYTLFFLLTAIYFTTVTGVVGTYRYKLPVVPFICIMAAYGYIKLFSKRENVPNYTVT